MADSAPSIPVSSGPTQSRSDQVVAICLSMLALSSIAVIARIWIRLALVRVRFGADDWAILVSWAFSIAFIVDVVSRTYAQSLLGPEFRRLEYDPFSTI